MRILIADDEITLLELIKQSLLNEGFSVDAVSSKDEIKSYLDSYTYQVLVLDRNFYGIDIMNEIIKYAKNINQNMGILVISAMSSVDDKVSGLLKGADDYLEKPFDNKELKARIYALSRRFISNIYNFEDVSINLETKQVRVRDSAIALSRNEAKLIFLLLSKRGYIFSRDEIIDSIYMYPEEILSNSVDELISRIRKKVNPRFIKTIKTRGFMID
ncbi:response regulator transcription factor [Helicobacter sp. MIT 14-3879]|uniref:response regulator transcription factor n=1 Tax=Helicobacter sp. MIT 14-3879 TaxID=2040649 RepID=UPI000E1F472F|nr:response regulator transcription factor [Helicobacter sp. MIT 14-3879]RDU65554.1 DNA-binding response regulator [Helicobacter sp. MIT 14-3879]